MAWPRALSFFIVTTLWGCNAVPGWAVEYTPWTAPVAELTSAMPFPGNNIEKLSTIPAKSFNCLCDVSPLSKAITEEQSQATTLSEPVSVTVALSEGLDRIQTAIREATPGSSVIVTGAGMLSQGTLTLRPEVQLILKENVKMDPLGTVTENASPGFSGTLASSSLGTPSGSGVTVIAEHMKNIATLFRDPTQVTPSRESRRTQRQILRETKALERSVNQTILEAKKGNRKSLQEVSRTWRDFQKNILRPAIIEDAKKDGSASRVLAYAQGSMLFEKLLRSEITRAP